MSIDRHETDAAGASSGPSAGEEPHHEAARAALFRWAEVVSSGRLEDVLSLYAPDAILVPTLSDEIRERASERRRYFEFFLGGGPVTCEIDVQKKRVGRTSGAVVIGGLYTFRFGSGDAARVVPARFLFTFEEVEGRWLITGHHSSTLSEAL